MWKCQGKKREEKMKGLLQIEGNKREIRSGSWTYEGHYGDHWWNLNEVCGLNGNRSMVFPESDASASVISACLFLGKTH